LEFLETSEFFGRQFHIDDMTPGCRHAATRSVTIPASPCSLSKRSNAR
jgi:hypothetical protein